MHSLATFISKFKIKLEVDTSTNFVKSGNHISCKRWVVSKHERKVVCL